MMLHKIPKQLGDLMLSVTEYRELSLDSANILNPIKSKKIKMILSFFAKRGYKIKKFSISKGWLEPSLKLIYKNHVIYYSLVKNEYLIHTIL